MLATGNYGGFFGTLNKIFKCQLYMVSPCKTCTWKCGAVNVCAHLVRDKSVYEGKAIQRL